MISFFPEGSIRQIEMRKKSSSKNYSHIIGKKKINANLRKSTIFQPIGSSYVHRAPEGDWKMKLSSCTDWRSVFKGARPHVYISSRVNENRNSVIFLS